MHVLERHFKYKLGTQLLGRCWMLTREGINSLSAVKDTNIKRQIISLMAGGESCFFLHIILWKKIPKTQSFFSCLLLTVKCRLICFQVGLAFWFPWFSTVLCITKSKAAVMRSVSLFPFTVNSLNFWQIDFSFVSVTLICKTDNEQFSLLFLLFV